MTEPANNTVFFIDAYHGGVTFWDWIVSPGGGLWYFYFWPLVGEALMKRLRESPHRPAVFDMDGHAYEDMARWTPEVIAGMRRAVEAGSLEIANGTYGQPLSQTVSGESNVRHFFFGLRAIHRAVAAQVDSFVSQEPLFFPQLPQVLAGFGFRGVVLRTHWAPFGREKAFDSAFVRWRGPDGTEILTAPRYGFMRYDLLGPEHVGSNAGALLGGDVQLWGDDRFVAFRAAVAERRIRPALLTRAADLKQPESPLPDVERLESAGLRLVTARRYFDMAPARAPVVTFRPEDLPSTIPWGLGGDRLQRQGALAEGALLAAERLDAVAATVGGRSRQRRLERAWKQLLLSQHHDLHVCGPALSTRHNKAMMDVGADMAHRARRAAATVASSSLGQVAARIDTSGSGETAVVVFNPSAWPRREYLQIPVGVGGRLARGDREIAVQRVGNHVGFLAELPSIGYRVFGASTALRSASSGQGTWARAFDGHGYRATMHDDGTLRIERDGHLLAAAAGHLTVYRDGRWYDSRGESPRVRLLADGPVFRRYLVRGSVGGVPFRESVTLYRELPRIDLRTEVNFGAESRLGPQMADHSRRVAYYLQDDRKLCLNLESPLGRCLYESPYLVASSRGGRVTGLGWVALDDGRGSGLALLNRGTRGHHWRRKAGVLRQVLAWGPDDWLYAGDDLLTRGPSQYTPMRGRHVYHLAILPYRSQVELLRGAHDYLVPCQALTTEPSEGDLPPSASLLTVEPAEPMLAALFQWEGALHARLWNGSPRAQTARLISGGRLVRAVPVSLDLERAEGSARVRRWGIQTFRLEGLVPVAGGEEP